MKTMTGMIGLALLFGSAACSLPNETATEAAAFVTGDFSDSEILQVIHTLNNGEIMQARTALEKSNDAEVRRTAQMILDDHSASNDRILAMGVALEESPASRGLGAQAKELNDELRELSGAEFDRVYLEKQAEQHEIALETVHEQLLPDADNDRMREFLTTTASGLERHLHAAEEGHRVVSR